MTFRCVFARSRYGDRERPPGGVERRERRERLPDVDRLLVLLWDDASVFLSDDEWFDEDRERLFLRPQSAVRTSSEGELLRGPGDPADQLADEQISMMALPGDVAQRFSGGDPVPLLSLTVASGNKLDRALLLSD